MVQKMEDSGQYDYKVPWRPTFLLSMILMLSFTHESVGLAHTKWPFTVLNLYSEKFNTINHKGIALLVKLENHLNITILMIINIPNKVITILNM